MIHFSVFVTLNVPAQLMLDLKKLDLFFLDCFKVL